MNKNSQLKKEKNENDLGYLTLTKLNYVDNLKYTKLNKPVRKKQFSTDEKHLKPNLQHVHALGS